MANPGNYTADSSRLRRRWDAFDRLGGRKPSGGAPKRAKPRLEETLSFGANPGALRMLSYAPPGLKPGAPLVVVLHGCTQNAIDYDASSGWSRLAEAEGFAVLYPEQRAGNNAHGCFNWFQLADASRGLGEALSIREMIEAMALRHELDRSRIFVTGLSAGGAMAASLLGHYPEVFAGGAIVAGLPCGAAGNVTEAFQAMGRPTARSGAELGDRVRSGSRHDGPWPVVSIWHGTADSTVAPKNADELVKQWLDVHGVHPDGFREETIGAHRKRVWRAGERDVVECVLVSGMGHGTPVDAGRGEAPGPYMLNVGLSSTGAISAFWGISKQPVEAKPAKATRSPDARPARPKEMSPDRARPGAQTKRPSGATGFAGRMEAPSSSQRDGGDIGSVIAKALRAAGLMR
ncbi:alpha/beta hydrolase family esterase [Hansschlegelia sp. KR7-227]|uniref:extracellular catalytic domain type 1 short-chain-length polyhydroxyalkanoate depolymerase n=1 Tax=Hansschlegelia sp. KR7-227 TaxID=3400914 RepID=UPI003BFBAF38